MSKSAKQHKRPIAALRQKYAWNSFDIDTVLQKDGAMLRKVKKMAGYEKGTIDGHANQLQKSGLFFEISVDKFYPEADRFNNKAPEQETVTVYSKYEKTKLEFITLKNVNRERTVMMVSTLTKKEEDYINSLPVTKADFLKQRPE